ncbi:hypothetical protein OG394_27735 [Kribbella sp. NBC_01245]|uniref:hypothetical protein n=1 Tax=Kribbella sp. NBC_01245 TaxID=2903578 RepID=UPI002E2B96DE|nr:hypothetical protein [Kribbella sp. NBC_01245]
MRFVRIALGLSFALIGLLTAIVAAVIGFFLIGPDDTVWSPEQQLKTPGTAAISAPELLNRHGPTLQVSARQTAGDRPLFVGVARDLDVASYLQGVRHLEIDHVQLPMHLGGVEVNTETRAVPPPTGPDWWVARGDRSLTWPIADGPYDVVVMNADGKPEVDVLVRYGVELPGAFVITLAIGGAGLLLLAVGLVLLFRGPRQVAPAPTSDAPSSAEPVRRTEDASVRRTAGVVAMGVLVLSATSCSAVPETDTALVLSRPAVTPEAARGEVRRYNEVFNAAARTRDVSVLPTIEGGPLLVQSQASFRVGKALRKPVVPPFFYSQPLISAPDYTGYPMRFVVSSGLSSDQKVRQLGVWQRENAGSPWLVTHSVRPPAAMQLPDLTGLRVPSAADIAIAKNAATDLATYFTKGKASTGAFIPSPDTTQLLRRRAADIAKDRRDVYISGVTDTFRVRGEPVAFVTTTGEVLVFIAIGERYLQTIRLGEAAKWARGDVTAFSNGKEFSRALTYDMLHQVALVVPPKGNGKARILSVDSQLTGAGGS